jgi:hypothetical protein
MLYLPLEHSGVCVVFRLSAETEMSVTVRMIETGENGGNGEESGR